MCFGQTIFRSVMGMYESRPGAASPHKQKKGAAMPVVLIGSQRYTTVEHLDPPGHGNACHEYRVSATESPQYDTPPPFATIMFQNGPVGEGINGCHNEDLLAVVLHRLHGFQQGRFACKANQEAITAIEEAFQHLQGRTEERRVRGVEGTETV